MARRKRRDSKIAVFLRAFPEDKRVYTLVAAAFFLILLAFGGLMLATKGKCTEWTCFRWMRTAAESAAGENREEGIYHGRKHYLIEEPVAPNEASDELVRTLERFSNRQIEAKLYLMLVPNKAEVLGNKLPLFADAGDQNAWFDQTSEALPNYTYIDARESLIGHQSEDIYYHTDRDWTALGVRYAFEELAAKLEIAPEAMLAMKEYPVSNSFTGSMAKKSGYETGYKEVLRVNVQADARPSYVVTDEDGVKSASLYRSAELEGEEQKKVYASAGEGILKIETTAGSAKKLLVIKSSFGDAMIPMLAPYYRQITVVDPVYCEEMFERILRETEYDQILFLYDGNTFYGDGSLLAFLKGENGR